MEEPKLYPLTSAQLLNFMSWRYTFHKQIMNIPSSIFVDAPMDLEVLKKAAEEAVGRNDSFGIRVTKRGKETMQYFTDRKALVIEIIDFSGQTDAKMNEFFHRTGRKMIPVYDRPLAKIYIVRTPEGTAGIFTCICHLMMDTWAISMFYKDILAIYTSYTSGAPMPAPIRDFEPVVRKELEYRSSDRHKKDLEFWREELMSFGKLPAFTHVNGTVMLEKYRRLIRKPDHPFGRTAYIRTTAKHELLTAGKPDVDMMADFCVQQNIPTLQPLFFVGLRTYLARVNSKVNDVTIGNIIARRGTLEEKYCGGSRPLALFCRTVMDEDTSFADALRCVMEKQNLLYRHANANTFEILGMAGELFGKKEYEGYCTTYMTFQPIHLDPGSGIKTRTEWYCNGSAAMCMYVVIMDSLNNGTLSCYYEYMDKHIKAGTIRRCHDYIMKVIRAGIADPSITIKELMELPV